MDYDIMDEDIQIQWSFISKLIDKIGEQAERLKWDALIDNVAAVFDESSKETDAAKLFFEPYQYLFRLYYRVKFFDEPRPFNEISETTQLIGHEDKPFFRIQNYDYKLFLWSLRKGFTEYLGNNIIDIPKDQLTPSQTKKFSSRIKK